MITLSPDAFKHLLEEDLEWLKQHPLTLERDHIEAILNEIIKNIEDKL